MVYNKKHKIVLQAIMHKGALSEKCGKELLVKLFDHDNAAQILSEINAKLQPLYMIVKSRNCEVTGQLYWVFSSTVQNKTVSFLHPEFSQSQLAFLNAIYSEIITSGKGYLSSTWCLNLGPTIDLKLTKADCETFLKEMIKRKWLFCKQGKVFIGVRSIAELQEHFEETYEANDTVCALCQQPIYFGAKCNKCDTLTHIHCMKDCTTDGNDFKCSNCQNLMPRYDPTDENFAMNLNEILIEENLDNEMTNDTQASFSQSKRSDDTRASSSQSKRSRRS